MREKRHVNIGVQQKEQPEPEDYILLETYTAKAEWK